MTVSPDFMTMRSIKTTCAILGTRLDAGFPASKDGAHPCDNLTDILAAHDQIYIPIIFFKTFFVIADISPSCTATIGTLFNILILRFGDRVGAKVNNN